MFCRRTAVLLLLLLLLFVIVVVVVIAMLHLLLLLQNIPDRMHAADEAKIALAAVSFTWVVSTWARQVCQQLDEVI